MPESESQSLPNKDKSTNFDFYDDRLFFASSDQPYMQLLGYMFTGHNYISWKRDSYHALISKNKEGFVDGTVKQPDKTDKRYHQWIRCDLMVMKWLMNSLESHIRDTVQYVSSSNELWTELAERYGQANSVEIYQLMKKLSTISQENLPLIYCKLLKRTVDRDSQTKLIQFLMGLNGGYEGVKTNILSMDPLPPLNKALSLLQKIERQKQVSDAIDVLAEANAYVAHQSSKQPDFKKARTGGGDTSVKICSNCNQCGHIREDCFKLKDCSFCGRRGHIKEHCFKLRDSRSIRGRGKPTFRGGSNVYKRSAFNADVVVPQGHSEDDLSLDDPLTVGAVVPLTTTLSHSTNLSQSFNPDVMTGLVNTVVQEVIWFLQDQCP
ncbi:hypothetical protein RND81_08G022100 [Saponaria officinalis]|uniref:CCHC-type domain-containing protein n=1 Tax=Saponaria officinalis TaxID=3572 RepID=A0AAW1J2W3_SAPOF